MRPHAIACWLVLVAAMLSGCVIHDGPPTSEPSGACVRYLSCLTVASPQTYAAQLELYGPRSECWEDGPEYSFACGMACRAALEQIQDKCECDGTTCVEPPPPPPPPPTCVDHFEPNDDFLHPYVTAISGTGTFTIPLGSAAICPESDLDMFELTVADDVTVRASASSTDDSVVIALWNGVNTLDARVGTLESRHLPKGVYVVALASSYEPTDYSLQIVVTPTGP